jgi:23S rRNA (guanosine2251-2'-O)-methyltransferase
VAGRRPVEEAFVARREARRLLVVPQRRLALEKLVLHATNLRIPVVEVEGGSLTAIAGFDGHQGIALVVAPRQWAGLDDVLAVAAGRHEAPLVLVLDSLEDPQNVGTLLRSAEASGVHGAIFPTHRQAPLTPAAVKASAGAVEHLRLAPVDDLPGALADLHARGLRIVGADGDAPLSAREADLRGPIAIVVGSEGRGLGPAVRRRCDLLVRIPMHGRIDSLNAAVAGSILLYEAAAQRGLPEATSRANHEEPDVTVPGVEPAPPITPEAPDGPHAAEAAPAEVPEAAPAEVPEPPAQAPEPSPVPRPPARRPKTGRSHPDASPDVKADAEPDPAGDDLLPGAPPVAQAERVPGSQAEDDTASVDLAAGGAGMAPDAAAAPAPEAPADTPDRPPEV